MITSYFENAGRQSSHRFAFNSFAALMAAARFSFERLPGTRVRCGVVDTATLNMPVFFSCAFMYGVIARQL